MSTSTSARAKCRSTEPSRTIVYAALCNLSQDQSAGTPAVESDFGLNVLTSSDPAELEKKLS
eukprot:4519128-Amphidinium_carterae.1